MDMQGSRQLSVTQQQAWDALNDADVLKACIVGCDLLDRVEDNMYALAVSVKVGPVAAKFAGKISMTDIQAPESYTLNFQGQGGAAGFGKGQAQVSLVPNEQGCMLNYTVNAQVGGKIAQVGQRLIDGVAKSMAEDFFKRFDVEMERQYPSVAASDAADSIAEGGVDTAVTAENSLGIPGWAWVVVGAGLLALFVYLM